MAGFDARRFRRKNPNALLLGLKMSEHFMRDKERGKLTHHTWEQGCTIRCLSGYISSVSESGVTTTTTMILPRCQSTAASPWLLLLCLAVAASGGALQARAQTDVNGFISIDRGLAGKTTSYVDDTTKLLYTSDTDFIGNVGSTHNISTQYMVRPTQLSRRYHSARSFPDGVRNCYTLRSLVPGGKYLLRASFMYGDYDGLGSLPIFDLHVGVNYWQTVNISKPDLEVTAEAVVFVPDEFVHVCLLNTDAGTPFISDLELRPLKKKFYPQANLTQGLVLEHRLNLAPPDTNIVRELYY
ncbi:putative leucine-rich repeat receptor-like protein kinase At2g19210 [Triticum aestivum]|uniref:putative leucine-rich repeat receptor-like protein kinase At2g19210 n=1 Tax=Triticum aestivum TaxID=4565 RepID=UPI001D028F2B|nr:putative leucine-rich repeat receptor-like protein kinase At2g19210 [Triticum aestivum]